MFCTSSFRSCQGILKAPALGHTILKEFPVDIPVPAHGSATAESPTGMVVAPETAVMLYRASQGVLQGQTVYISSSGICLRTDIPKSTHGFDVRIMIAQMILAGLVVFDNSLHPDPPHELPQ